MKFVNIKSNTYIYFDIENNDEDPKFKVGKPVKCKNIFAKGYVHSKSVKKFLRLEKLKILCHGHLILLMSRVKKLLERFTKKNFKEQIRKSLELKK